MIPTALVAIAADGDRERVAEVLTADGFEVSAAADGFGLLEHITGAMLNTPGSEPPTLVIADAVLPGRSGLSMLTRLRELGWQTPVILLTAADDHEARWHAWDHGVTGLFIEPYDPREVGEFSRIVLDPEVGEAIRAAHSSSVTARAGAPAQLHLCPSS